MHIINEMYKFIHTVVGEMKFGNVVVSWNQTQISGTPGQSSHHIGLRDVTTIPTPTCLCSSLSQRSDQTTNTRLPYNISISYNISIIYNMIYIMQYSTNNTYATYYNLYIIYIICSIQYIAYSVMHVLMHVLNRLLVYGFPDL